MTSDEPLGQTDGSRHDKIGSNSAEELQSSGWHNRENLQEGNEALRA